MKPNKKVIINMLTSSESCNLIHNGNQTYWNPIWSIIIRVINKMDNCKAGVQLLVTSMITNRIRRHEVLTPINQNYDKI